MPNTIGAVPIYTPGAMVEVIKPKSLRDLIREEAANIVMIY